MAIFPGTAITPAGGAGYTIDQSLRFNDDDDAYLDWTPSSDGNRQAWTYSTWVKRGNVGSIDLGIFSADGGSSGGAYAEGIRLNFDKLYLRVNLTTIFNTTALFRDPSAWYHVVVVWDTTNATSSDRVRLYVNGERITAFDTLNLPSLNDNSGAFNRGGTIVHRIGEYGCIGCYDYKFDGYMAEVHFIDGQALDPSYFGEADETYGHWKPIAYEGTYGTNGFYLDFSNSGSIGEDQAGSNDWTANNLAATDVVLDSPTNNFATLNPLAKEVNPPTFFEGNLKAAETAGTTWRTGYSWLMSNGKWYWEITPTATSGGYNLTKIGIVSEAENTAAANAQNFTKALWYDMEGTKRQGTSATSYGSSYTTGDIVGVALDMDSNTITFYKNNVSQGQLDLTALNVGTDNVYLAFAVVGYYAVLNAGQDSSFAGNKTAQNNTDANGIGDFYYAPPSGFLALCTANLPDPAVIPGDNFNTVLYTGNGSTQSITGVNFQPDFVWNKPRSFGGSPVNGHNTLYDVIRGATKELYSDLTSGEATNGGSLTSFDADGFSVGSEPRNNASGQTYVAWAWKADNTSGSSNTDGSITSTVAANTAAGFSIVSYTGTGSAATVGHGLSSAPEMVIVKNRGRSATNWRVYHNGIASDAETDYLTLDSTNAAGDLNFWNDTAPTSSVFSVFSYDDVGRSGDNYIAYCFHSVDGYSKFGSYTGNGSTDGPFVYTGFRPAFILIKRTDAAYNWILHDADRSPYNPSILELFPNLSSAENEAGARGIDLLSNGFKLRGNQNEINTSGNNYIYMAFAEYPFKYTNARGSSNDKYTPPDTTYTIDQSLRFNDDDSAYLSRTPSAAGNRKTWTWSGWVKLGKINDWEAIFGAGADNNNQTRLRFDDNGGRLFFDNEVSGTSNQRFYTTRLFRDPSAWYHIVLAVDTTHSTSTNRVKFYVNGEQVTSFDQSDYPAQNLEYHWNNNVEQRIGADITPSYFDGYMADVYFIDGQALGPEHFGYKDATYGDWRPTTYSDGNPEADYGSNGFHLKFESGFIGTDSSPMGNDWTANNMSGTNDVVLDTPTNNFCTLNPLARRRDVTTLPTYSEGNLKAVHPNAGGNATYGVGSMSVSSGKWYFECYQVNEATNILIGIADRQYDENLNSLIGYYSDNGGLYRYGTNTATGATYTTGDTIGIAFDLDNSTMTCYKNGVSQGTIAGTWSNTQYPTIFIQANTNNAYVLNCGQDSSFAGNKTAQNNTDDNGVGDFYYAPPSGFLALCTANLSDPAVVPGENFNTVLYTGTGSAQTISGVGFQPDFIWLKDRSTSNFAHYLTDAIRGFDKYLFSNLTNAEGTNATRVTSVNSDGFAIGNDGAINTNTSAHVAWNWKANNTSGSSNTDGSITSTVAANPDAGFSIVAYTGNGGNGVSVGHGLSQTPDIVILKARNGSYTSVGWGVVSSLLGSTSALKLNTTDAAISAGGVSNNTLPTSTTFTVADNYCDSGADHIAYCFHSVDGYSKFGSYTGNSYSAGTNGPFVYTGFCPAFVMVKRTDTSGYSWVMYDSKRGIYNQIEDYLQAESSNSESAGGDVAGFDFLSNGFKPRNNSTSSVGTNIGNGTYIYMAFAEYPFKYTNAR